MDIDPVIDEMRDLGREFIALMNVQDVVENGNTVNGKQRDGIDTWKMQIEYAVFDMHLFGISCTCDVPIMEGKTLCSHD